MLAGYGTRAVLRRYGRRPLAIVIALTLLIVVEGWFAAGTVEVPRPMPAGIIPEGAVVLDLPIGSGPENAVPQYRAVLGGYRTINGYSGYEPPFFPQFLKALGERRRGALAGYLSAGDLYVIIRPGVEPALREWITSFPGTIPWHYQDGGSRRCPHLSTATPAALTRRDCTDPAKPRRTDRRTRRPPTLDVGPHRRDREVHARLFHPRVDGGLFRGPLELVTVPSCVFGHRVPLIQSLENRGR